MVVCGMLKGFNVLFVVMGLYSDVFGGYMVINVVGDVLFIFFFLFLGYILVKKFGLKLMLGLVLGVVVCYFVI